MAVAKEDTGFRYEVHLTGTQRLDEELGSFGRWVGPRFDAIAGSRMGDRKRLGEEWSLRCLLIALAATDRLDYPATLRVADAKYAEQAKLPDAVLYSADDRGLGVEVTQATSEVYQRHLTEIDERAASASSDEVVAELDPGDGYVGDGPERQATDEIEAAISRKLEKLERRDYGGVDSVDLLVYLNSQTSIHISPADICERIRSYSVARRTNTAFRQIHILFDDAIALNSLGTSCELIELRGRYEFDFHQWCADQAWFLDERQFDKLDFANLAEEVGSLSRKEARSRDSQIRRLLVHLLKWTYQRDKRTTSWARSITNARIEIEDEIEDSPSLGGQEALERAIDREYARAVRQAVVDTGLKKNQFPASCPFSLRQIFDPDYPDDLVNED
jgi:hypothetical protein